MQIYCLGDVHTVRGLRLAGVPGRAAESREQTLHALRELSTRPECGLLILTEVVSRFAPAEVSHLLSGSQPLVLLLPDATGPFDRLGGLGNVVEQAVGIRLES